MCVEARLAIMSASDNVMWCLTRTHHERQRIAVWVAFLGRWQMPINVVIMKAIENALFTPMRGCIRIQSDIPYMAMRRLVRNDFTWFYHTLRERRDYLARLNRELHEARELLRRSQGQRSGASQLCHFLERQLGLVLDDAP